MDKIKLEEVFKRSGIPTYTFVQPPEYNKLLIGTRTPGRNIIVEGPSGIGKTTCVLKIIEELGIDKKSLVLSARKKSDVEIIKNITEIDNIGYVIIDDFHKLDEKTKITISDYIKSLADEENADNKLILIGINKAGDSLIKMSPDLAGRVDTIHFEQNPENKIEELIKKGEKTLKIKFNIRDELIKESYQSFHITQMLCYETCLEAGIFEEKDKETPINISIEVIKSRVYKDLSARFLPLTRQFATGPRLRREGRAPYLHILHWLSESNDWSLNIDKSMAEHQELRGSISQIIEKGYFEDFINKNLAIRDIFHYDKETKILGVEDPKYIYFLKNILWSKFASLVGYTSIVFKSKYDFALSFAGVDRSYAKHLFEALTNDYELSVFYDFNEQHRILAENLEDYFAPIYKSEAIYVIVFLGNEYPKRIWTRFESEQFKERFGDKSVIPVIFDDTEISTFDKTAVYGSFKIDRKKNIKKEVNSLADLLNKKIGDYRLENTT